MKRKDKNTPIKENNETNNILKNRYYHQPKAPAERIHSTFSSAITRKRKKK